MAVKRSSLYFISNRQLPHQFINTLNYLVFIVNHFVTVNLTAQALQRSRWLIRNWVWVVVVVGGGGGAAADVPIQDEDQLLEQEQLFTLKSHNQVSCCHPWQLNLTLYYFALTNIWASWKSLISWTIYPSLIRLIYDTFLLMQGLRKEWHAAPLDLGGEVFMYKIQHISCI